MIQILNNIIKRILIIGIFLINSIFATIYTSKDANTKDYITIFQRDIEETKNILEEKKLQGKVADLDLKKSIKELLDIKQLEATINTKLPDIIYPLNLLNILISEYNLFLIKTDNFINNLKSDKLKYNTKIEDLKANKKDLTQEIQALKNQINKLHQQNKDLEKKIQKDRKIKSKNMKVSCEKAEEGEIILLEKQINNLREENKILKSKIENLNNINVTNKKLIRHIDSENNYYKTKNNILKYDNKDLNSELIYTLDLAKNRKKEIDLLKVKIDLLSIELYSKESLLEGLRNKILFSYAPL